MEGIYLAGRVIINFTKNYLEQPSNTPFRNMEQGIIRVAQTVCKFKKTKQNKNNTTRATTTTTQQKQSKTIFMVQNIVPQRMTKIEVNVHNDQCCFQSFAIKKKLFGSWL